ncbi:hypothetical protein B0H13DRAFT_1900774 [Mycena leptocephala]|nr:hypothetical protein B0H13DRAFT_1900774 [Mycena leptocephala]
MIHGSEPGESRAWLNGGTCHLGTTRYGLMSPMMVTAAVHLFFHLSPPTHLCLPTFEDATMAVPHSPSDMEFIHRFPSLPMDQCSELRSFVAARDRGSSLIVVLSEALAIPSYVKRELDASDASLMDLTEIRVSALPAAFPHAIPDGKRPEVIQLLSDFDEDEPPEWI